MSADAEEKQAAWGFRSKGEPRWPATVAVLVAILLYLRLPDQLFYGPRYLVPALELALLIPLQVFGSHRLTEEAKWRRMFAIALIALVNLSNLSSLLLLVYHLTHKTSATGLQLLFSASLIWITNVIVFALWFWELDRGGPGARCARSRREPDFLFPQMVNPESAPNDWTPSFLDYLYVSSTNATAFSPTDTMPLTEWAKMLMLVQGVASLVTVALVAARAVNILQ